MNYDDLADAGRFGALQGFEFQKFHNHAGGDDTVSATLNAATLLASIGAGRFVVNDYTLTISEIEVGHRLTIQRGNDVQEMDVLDGAQGPQGIQGVPGKDGQNGSDGQDGADGFSPTVTITEIEGGHRITITDAEGPHEFDVMDGQGGSGGTGDHTQLTNRDANDQHPMSAITGLVAALAAKGTYSKPDLGIPASDMTAAVQESIGLANSALQSESDPTVPQWAKAAQKPSYTAQEVGAATPSDVQSAAGALQEQIDALVSKSDVVDVVANYDALQAYDTSTLLNNNVVKVLSDSTHSDGRSYYRWTATENTGAWAYIGTESVGYTKAETDNLLNAKQPTIIDLATIRSGAAAGATAVQPSALSSYATQTYVNQQIAAQDTETWTFTLDDGTTVTKQVVVKS